MHGWNWSGSDTVLNLEPGSNPDAALGYAIAAAICMAAPWLGARQADGSDSSTSAESEDCSSG